MTSSVVTSIDPGGLAEQHRLGERLCRRCQHGVDCQFYRPGLVPVTNMDHPGPD